VSIFSRGIQTIASGRYPQFNNYVSPLSQLYGQTSMTSAAGERIDEWTALGVSSVLSAVSLLADSVATMTLRCYTINSDGFRVSKPLPDVIADPDPESNIYELIHQIVASMALHGNAYVKIDRDKRGNMIALVPLHPYQMQVLPTGDMAGRRYLHLGNEMNREDIMHLRWFTPPQSLVGISPLNQARNLIGLSLAMDRHLSQFYAEGGTPSGVLESPGKLNLEQARVIQGTWEATHRRHRRPAVLSDGLTFKPINTSAADAEMTKTREQLVRDVARVFRIPSHLILASGDNQTYMNVEQASLNYLTHTIAPWLRRIEIGFSQILDKGDDVVFDTSSLLRLDAITRANVAKINVALGAQTPNEVRRQEGLEPYEGGDVFHQAFQGAALAGGAFPALGEDTETSGKVMGLLE